MADTKTTGLTEYDGVPAVGDWVPFVDVSDTTMAPSGTTKKMNADRFIYTTGTANTLAANLDVNSKNLTNVGTVTIGTATGSRPLHVHAPSGDSYLRLSNATFASGADIGCDSTNFYYWIYGSVDLRFATNNLTRFTISKNGNIGFGTTAPATHLHVHDTGSNYIRVSNATFPTGLDLGFDGVNGYLWNYQNNAMVFATNNLERMRITNSGSVGINITPSYLLDVVAGSGSQSILRAGQSGISNGLTVTSDGSTLTYTLNPSVTVAGGTITCIDLVETSSQDLKENLEEIPTVLDRLVGLKAYRYNRKGDPVTHKRIGLIAEQVGSVFPEVVSDVTIYENDEEVTTKGINYGRMSTLAMLGLNELVGRLQTAKEFLDNKIQQGANKLADHEQRIRVLEAKVAALGAR